MSRHADIEEIPPAEESLAGGVFYAAALFWCGLQRGRRAVLLVSMGQEKQKITAFNR